MNEPIQRRRKSLAVFTTALLFGIALCTSRFGQLPADGQENKPHAAVAAKKFLDSLEAKQREKALYEFGSPRKSVWSNLPVSAVPRNGVELGGLTKEQRTLAMEVVASVLSKSGYQKVVDIMDGDQKLAEGGGGKGGKDKGDKGKDDKAKGDKGDKGKGKGGKGMFGTDKYYLAIFGTPSEKEPWMMQFGGHHLGVNVTVIGNNYVLTPTHTGAQPTLFKRGESEVRPLGLENDTAFKLVNGLDEGQKAKAIIGAKAQGELLLGPGQDARKVPASEGIKGSALTAKQQAMLLDVIGAWVDIVEPTAARKRLEEIKGKIGETYFAWKGPTEMGSAAYFRIQGPTIWIEYAPQGGTGHIHTVIRNPTDDYAANLLKAKE